MADRFANRVSDSMARSLNHHRAGAGEPLVLIHGIGSSWRAWLPVMRALEARHEVFAIDLPGFGDSPPLGEGVRPTVPALVDAVEGQLDELGLERPHLAGNSLGGWVALELARRGRARSATGVSPAGMWTPREAAYARGQLKLAYAATRRLRPHARAVTRTAAGRTGVFSLVSSRPWQLDPAQACHALEAIGGSETFLETLELSTTDRAWGLDEIGVPVTIAWGSRDRLLLPRQGPRFVRMIPGSELRPLAGAGHVPMWDDADLVTRTILDRTARAA
ncbi:MAG: N-formylglutamate deformylase [uncultured Solirubrobacterales bacterium]|uniref:N-formylglutamate deformylase n=1 Tax=uncultured Solirubrobacterales bacterium TaxID=768556 RepID=A0A6J4T4D4_9ACTN|nr:MAG: N-formylglutamate deformylase [uncultured Solirubrobacterales bacterium]